MNKKELIEKISIESGVRISDCEKVLDVLQKILDSELSSSKNIAFFFDKVHKLMSILKAKK